MYPKISLPSILISGFGILFVIGFNLSPLPPHSINVDKFFKNFFIHI